MFVFYLLIFIVSFFILAIACERLIVSLTRLAKFLGWKEFVVAFFTMALAGAIPNLSVGISSAIHKIPQLSFSEIVGGNIIDLSIAVALAALISKKGLTLPSRVVQGSAFFTIFIALLPLFLIADGNLSRTDGFLLIFTFFVYIVWLFGKKERFSKKYNRHKKANGKYIFKNVATLVISIGLLLVAAEGIVRPASYFSEVFGLPIALIGILVVGLGNALPEIFFSIQAARKGQDWLVVGNLMGSVIIPATLVLGIVAVMAPIQIMSFSPFAIGRFFLIFSAIFFLLFIRTGQRVTKQEGIFLLLIYLIFVFAEILFAV